MYYIYYIFKWGPRTWMNLLMKWSIFTILDVTSIPVAMDKQNKGGIFWDSSTTLMLELTTCKVRSRLFTSFYFTRPAISIHAYGFLILHQIWGYNPSSGKVCKSQSCETFYMIEAPYMQVYLSNWLCCGLIFSLSGLPAAMLSAVTSTTSPSSSSSSSCSPPGAGFFEKRRVISLSKQM